MKIEFSDIMLSIWFTFILLMVFKDDLIDFIQRIKGKNE